MERPNALSRRHFIGNVLGTTLLSTTPISAWIETVTRNPSVLLLPDHIPANRIGVQLFTVRDLLAENMLGTRGTFDLLREVGISNIELAGNYLGQTPGAIRDLAGQYEIRIIGNHYGPRTMDGENQWYDASGREKIFTEARELGLEFVGTGHYYNVPLTVDGFRGFAQHLNTWGAAAAEKGLKFYYHNHDGEFTRFNGKPIFDILLEETDPELVYFELDLGWAAIAGEDIYKLVRQHQSRFPYFHIKDFIFDTDGPRETKPNTLASGHRFSFTDVGKGQIDWARLFSGLEDPTQHVYLIERDDAGDDEMKQGSTIPPSNPAGSPNTIWVSHQYLTTLDF